MRQMARRGHGVHDLAPVRSLGDSNHLGDFMPAEQAAELPHASPGVTFGARYRTHLDLKRAAGVTTSLATDLSNGSPVVVMTWPLHLLPEGTELQVRHAVSALRGLNHPSVGRILDAGRQDGVLYMVEAMEEGMPLDERLRRHGPLTVEQGLVLARSLMAALVATSARGVLHRGIKPSN